MILCLPTIAIGGTSHILELILGEFDDTLRRNCAELVLFDPEQALETVSAAVDQYLLLAEPFPVGTSEKEDLLLVIDRAVDRQDGRLEVEAQLVHACLSGIFCFRKIELTMAESIAFPEDDLRVELSIREDSTLEASYEASIRHEADWKLKSLQWGLRDREDNLIVGSCRPFGHLEPTLHVSCQALTPAIDAVIDDKD